MRFRPGVLVLVMALVGPIVGTSIASAEDSHSLSSGDDRSRGVVRLVGGGWGGEPTQIDIKNNDGQTLTYPANTPFYFSNGWACTEGTHISGWTPCSEVDNARSLVRYFQIKGANKVKPLDATVTDRIPLPSAGPGAFYVPWEVGFPEGLPAGTRTFGTVWLWKGKIFTVDAITIRFRDSRNSGLDVSGAASSSAAGVYRGAGVRDPRVTGERINILQNDGLTLNYPADTAFHLRHGYLCDSDETTVVFDNPTRSCSLYDAKSRPLFFQIKGTGRVKALASQLQPEPFPYDEPGLMAQYWEADFPDGLPAGTRTFGVVWMYHGRVDADLSAIAATVKFTN